MTLPVDPQTAPGVLIAPRFIEIALDALRQGYKNLADIDLADIDAQFQLALDQLTKPEHWAGCTIALAAIAAVVIDTPEIQADIDEYLASIRQLAYEQLPKE